MGSVLRVWLLGLLCVAAWVLGSLEPQPARGPDAPPTEFSAARAGAVLARLLGPQRPHPAGSAENAAVHARAMAELARLGVPARIISGQSCYHRAGYMACATVSDIVAEPVAGDGKAILLMAHLDSVAAGPGAADDLSGVATILETARALKTAGTGGHPVMLLFTDGEETGLLGAQLFLKDAGLRARVGAVINVEARGTSGPSYLFQTSKGDERLVDIYARSVTRPATSSLYGEIYKYLPNDTDLTPFLEAGFAGANFAFIGGLADYHTPLERRENLSPASLQSQGDNVLGMARGLAQADFTALQGDNAVDFDVLRLWLPRLPARFAAPLAMGAFALLLLAGWLDMRGRPRSRPKGALRRVTPFLLPPFLLLCCVGSGFLLSALAALISGTNDPAFAHPLALRIALAASCWGFALMMMRGATATACWLWLAAFGIAAAFFAPGLSPYFIFPVCAASVLLLLTRGAGRGAALLLSAMAMMIVWLGLAAGSEAIMGLVAHPLFTLPVGLTLVALLPVLAAQKLEDGAWFASVILCMLVSLGATVAAGLQPAYTAAAPQRLNLRHVEKDGKSWMLADPVAGLPEDLRAAANFSERPQPLAMWRGYVAQTGNAEFPPPSASMTRQGKMLTIDLHGSDAAQGMLVQLAGLAAITVGDVRQVTPEGRLLVACGTADCARLHMVLEFSGAVPKSLLLAETRYDLPARAAVIAQARPDWAAPSGQGDMTLLAQDLAIPDR
jgi:hypothetical protein